MSSYETPLPDVGVSGFDLQGVRPEARKVITNRNAQRLTPLIDQIAVSEGVDPLLVHAIISQESRYNQTAVSHVGAGGLMQLMPATAARFGLTRQERYDPAKNIRAGVRYLKFLKRKFRGRLDLILAGYNAGEGAVLKYGRKIPPYRETQDYVRKVKGYYIALRRQNSRHHLLASNSRREQMRRSRVHREQFRNRSDQFISTAQGRL